MMNRLRAHPWLKAMTNDGYSPPALVAKGQQILVQLAERIGREAPKGTAVYALTLEAAGAFNELKVEFEAAQSELESVAREPRDLRVPS
jgi:hypothetical protein